MRSAKRVTLNLDEKKVLGEIQTLIVVIGYFAALLLFFILTRGEHITAAPFFRERRRKFNEIQLRSHSILYSIDKLTLYFPHFILIIYNKRQDYRSRAVNHSRHGDLRPRVRSVVCGT